MKIYLDFNVVVSITRNDLSINDVLANIGITGKPEFAYSSAHVFEIENIVADTPNLRRERIGKHLKSLEMITSNLYLYRELPSNNVIWLRENPADIYDTITAVGNIKPVFNSMMSVVPEEQKQAFRDLMGLDKKQLNNYKPEEVIKHLDAKIAGYGMSCVDMIEKGVELHPDGKSFSLHNRFGGMFELLDMLGYWTDKTTATSNVARLWDSSHCYFASFCDYFVSDDKRTRNKAKVVYGLYRIDTKVVSSKGEL